MSENIEREGGQIVGGPFQKVWGKSIPVKAPESGQREGFLRLLSRLDRGTTSTETESDCRRTSGLRKEGQFLCYPGLPARAERAQKGRGENGLLLGH